LGDRRAQHKQIVSCNLDGKHAYAARLYRTNCVTWLEDGRIFLDHGGYVSMSTSDFISAVLSWTVGSVYRKGGEMLFVNRHKALGNRVAPGNYVIPMSGLWLDACGEPLNPEATVVHTINRKGANAVRARYKPFLDYFNSMCKLCEYNFATELLVHPDTGNVPFVSRCGLDQADDRMLSDDIEDWFHLAKTILRKACVTSGYRYFHPDQTTLYIPATTIRNEVEDMLLRLHRDEMLTAVTLPMGTFKKDTYAHYF
jgi:hypothetical protein